ncbi:hypothetical protein K438DRAFT_1153768 [Mycena galopus ATCC 62051]|nr:hypothetical protein K438DRAFT_1153768 [Mycena galopus ATCC 62051]
MRENIGRWVKDIWRKENGKGKERLEESRINERKSVAVTVVCTVQVWLVGRFGFWMEPMEAETRPQRESTEQRRVGVVQCVRVVSASRTSTCPVLSSASSSDFKTRMRPTPPQLECGSSVRRPVHILVYPGGASQSMSSEGGVAQFMRNEGGVLHPRRVFILVIVAIPSAVRGYRDECWPGSRTRMGCMYAAAAEKERNALAGRRCPWRVDLRGLGNVQLDEGGRRRRTRRGVRRGYRAHHRGGAPPQTNTNAGTRTGSSRRTVARSRTARGRAEALLGGREELDVPLLESRLSYETRRVLVRTAKASGAAGRRRPGGRVRFRSE